MRTIDLNGRETVIVVGVGALWVAVALLGSIGLWFPALLLSIVMMVLLMMLGSAHRGKLNLHFFAFPLMTWALTWLVSFFLAYWLISGDQPPTFTILGMHPSFAAIFLGYFLGGVATLTGGFYLRRELWFSDARWEEFKALVKDEGEAAGDDL